MWFSFLLISLRGTLWECVRLSLDDGCTGVFKAVYTFSYTPFHYEVVKSHNLLESKIHTSEHYVICTKTFSLGGVSYFRKLKNKHFIREGFFLFLLKGMIFLLFKWNLFRA